MDKSRGIRRLGAASIYFEPGNETASSRGQNTRVLSRDFPARYGEQSTQPLDHTSPFKNRRGGDGPFIGTSPSGMGLVPLVTPSSSKDTILAESPAVPGVPVVYRTSEERLANPDRLNLDRRHLTVCPILEGEDHLRLLNLQHNSISRIQHLGHLRRLVFLDLYDNLISDITGLESLQLLRVLMLGRNKLCYIDGLKNLVKLDVLDLHGNMISEIENLDHLHHLRVLNLAGNAIRVVQGLSGLQSLAELNLRRNKITHCLVEELMSLQRLFLSHNNIECLDNITSLSCPSLVDLSVDGNPLAGTSHHRPLLLTHFNNLVTLSQQPISEEERKEASKVAQLEELKIQDLRKCIKMIEEKESKINQIKKEWERSNGEHISTSTCYIDEEGDVLSLYGTGSLDVLLSTKWPHIKALTLQYVDIKDILNVLQQLKDILPNAKSLHLHVVNLTTLVQVRSLSCSLPPTITSLTTTDSGNPVTAHTLYQSWCHHLMPRMTPGVIPMTPVISAREENVFKPLNNFSDNGIQVTNVSEDVSMVTGHLVTNTLKQYRKAKEYQEVWPSLFTSFVQEAITWIGQAI